MLSLSFSFSLLFSVSVCLSISFSVSIYLSVSVYLSLSFSPSILFLRSWGLIGSKIHRKSIEEKRKEGGIRRDDAALE